jgi:carbon-monoxide dehydrogenase medium subunit
MIPARFDYVAPSSLDDAIALMVEHGSDARLLSGGQSLIPMLKLRLATPNVVVDLNRLPNLGHIEERDGALAIGALAREADVERSAIVHSRYPILADTAAVVADPIVRNMATVCGNIAHGDPGNDHPATMIALDATIVSNGPRGPRSVKAREFFVGLFSTALEFDEIITELRIPAPSSHSGGAYLKLERKVGDYATAGVAVQLTLSADGACMSAGIGLTNVGPTPIEARSAEAFLLHKPIDDGTIAQAAHIAADEADPVDDRRGTAGYKRDVVRVLTARALAVAARRARGGARARDDQFTGRT